MIEYVPRQLLTATKTPTTIPTSSLMEPETRQLASPSNLNTKPATPEANAAQVYQPINYAYPSLVSSNESAATLYDSSSNAITDQSVNVASPVDLLDGELNSGSLSTKDDLGPQLEQLNQNSLFDAAELLNSESDIDKILEPKPFGNDKKRRKIA